MSSSILISDQDVHAVEVSLRRVDGMGVPIRSDGRRLVWDWDSLVRLLEKHRAGVKNSVIGEEYGVSGEYIRQLIQRAKKREQVRQAFQAATAKEGKH